MKEICCLKQIMICLLLFIPVVVSAQVIKGTVKDDEGEVLEFANVVLLDENKTFVTGVTTVKDGTFTIDRIVGDAKFYLVTSFVGRHSDTLSIDASTPMPINIILHVDKTIIGEVVVRGVRQLFKNENDVITANIEHTVLAKAGSLDKLMNQIPFVSGAEGKYNVFGRGYAIVYLNSHRVYDENILRTITSDRIKKIQVITNPGSRYPADVKSVI